MKLTKESKRVLDTVATLNPDNGVRYYTVRLVENETGLSYSDLMGILESLEEAKAIKWGDKQRSAFSVLERGRAYKEIDRLEKRDRWKERFWGFLIGVATTLITNWLVFKMGLV